MRTIAGFSATLLAVGLAFSAVATAHAAPASVNIGSVSWNSGVSSDSAVFTNTLLPPLTNPTALNTPSEIVFGNTITSGIGSDTFTNIPVEVDFSITQNSVTNSFIALGDINGSVSYDGTSGTSTAHILFTEIEDVTTGQVSTAHTGLDPGSMQSALDLITPVGGVYVDYAQPIPFDATPTTISGYLTPNVVPELGSCTALLSMLSGTGVLGLALRRRSRK